MSGRFLLCRSPQATGLLRFAKPPKVPSPNGRQASLELFGQLWAAASVFHVLGPSGRAFNVLRDPSPVASSHVALGIAALWLMLRPRGSIQLAGVAMAGLLSAYSEMPFLGSHWMLAALVNVGLIVSLAVARRGRKIDRLVLAESFLPLARWMFIAFYICAAFAKLNHAFFNPAVSCSTLFGDQILRTLLVPLQKPMSEQVWAHLVPVAVASVELSLPVFLASAQLNSVGVMIGLGFHSIIALNRVHIFFDFSAVVSALLILFLPDGFAVANGWRFRRATLASRIPAALAAVLLYGTVAGPLSPIGRFVGRGRLLAWDIFDTILLLAVGIHWLRTRSLSPSIDSGRWTVRPRWLVAFILCVVLNGVLPYFELRTAFAFNMYSNLTAIGGHSNHFIVTSSFPVGSRHAGLVRIRSSDDPGLSQYRTQGYDLPWSSFVNAG